MAYAGAMSHTLDCLVSDVFEDDDLARVADRVREGKADAHIARLRQAWEEWADAWVAPPLPPGNVRPFAFNNWRGYDDIGLVSAWADFVGNAEAASQIDQQIIRHLLFCHSIALPDPFFRSLDGEFSVPRWVGREGLAATIETVGRLKDLLKNGIIVVVPRQHPPVPEAAQVIGGSAAELFPAPPPGWLVIPPQQVVAIDLAQQIGSADGTLDPYLPTPAHVAIFRLLSASADALIRAAIGDATPNPSNAILPEILRCSLPDPTGVTLPDIIAIRRDGYFDDWRNALADGVDRFTRYVGENANNWPNPDMVLRDEIAAAVQDKAQQARKSTGWDNKPTVKVGVNLVLAGGAATAALLIAPPVAAAIAAFGALPTFYDVWARYRFRNGAYARHVALFAAD